MIDPGAVSRKNPRKASEMCKGRPSPLMHGCWLHAGPPRQNPGSHQSPLRLIPILSLLEGSSDTGGLSPSGDPHWPCEGPCCNYGSPMWVKPDLWVSLDIIESVIEIA